MWVHAARAFLSFALLAAPVAHAIFQDEAGDLDFQHALLGSPVPESTFFFQPTLSSKATLLYTISEKGVVGAINPKDGSLVWRQRQITQGTCSQSSTGYLGGANGTNAIVSAFGDGISSWEAASGRMLWSFAEVGCIKSLVVPDITGLTQDPIMVMDDGGLTKIISLNSITGKLIWEVKDNVGDIPHAISAGSTNVFYVALKPAMLKGYKIQVTTVNPTSARPVKQSLLSSDGEIKDLDNIIYTSTRATDPIIVWADKTLKTLKINVLGTDDITTIKVPSSGKQAVEKIQVHAPNSPIAKGYFIIQYTSATSHWAEIYQIDKSKKTVRKVHDLPESSGDGLFAASSIKDNVFFSRVTLDEVIVYFASTAEVLEKWPTSVALKELQTHGGGAKHLSAEVVTRGTSNYAVRGALILGSDDVVQVRNGEVDWTRSESLAGIRAAAWAESAAAEDLARELAIESHNNPLAAFLHRLARHVQDLQDLPAWLQALPDRIVQSVTGKSLGISGKESGKTDFGFEKLIVAATEKGRVIALDSGNHGEVVWTTKATDLPAGASWNVTDLRITGNQVIVHIDDGSSVTLEVSSGAIVQKTDPTKAGEVARTVPVSTSDGRSVLVQLSAAGVPQANLNPELNDRTVLVTQGDNRTLTGWMMNKDAPPHQIWSFATGESESIATTAHRPSHDPVASIGRALGDRNVLYKYLNPNIMVVVTATEMISTLNVYLLDTVNGQVLYRTQDTGVDSTKPITATMSENWFTYTFYTDPSLSPSEPAMDTSKGYVLTMSELFESPLPNDPGPLEDAANFSSLAGRAYIPSVISQSYAIPAPITYLTTTSTKQGITPRSLLAFSPALHGIAAIPVPLLSPRKPIGRDPTSAEREEGLVRYAPLLEIQPAWMISHTRELLGIEGMVVTPTHMESTSLVFAYGDLDLFGTRVSPIGSFDILGKGFGKVSLVLTIVALVVGTRFLAPMVQKKQINGLWSS